MRLAAIALVVSFLSTPCSYAQTISDEDARKMLRELQDSHIQGNVPPAENFDQYLRRDLLAHFDVAAEESDTLRYELLRDGPTQSGIGFPKYYVWISIDSTPGVEGAARVAAIDQKRFEVRQFVSLEEIAARGVALERVFPVPVVAEIRQRVDSVGD